MPPKVSGKAAKKAGKAQKNIAKGDKKRKKKRKERKTSTIPLALNLRTCQRRKQARSLTDQRRLSSR